MDSNCKSFKILCVDHASTMKRKREMRRDIANHLQKSHFIHIPYKNIDKIEKCMALDDEFRIDIEHISKNECEFCSCVFYDSGALYDHVCTNHPFKYKNNHLL